MSRRYWVGIARTERIRSSIDLRELCDLTARSDHGYWYAWDVRQWKNYWCNNGLKGAESCWVSKVGTFCNRQFSSLRLCFYMVQEYCKHIRASSHISETSEPSSWQATLWQGEAGGSTS